MEPEPSSPPPEEGKKKKQKAEVPRKSKGQILADYKISLTTFEDLLLRGLIKGPVIRERGKNFYEISANNDFVFRCARNDIASFRMSKADVPVFPFHRFLTLRFVNTSPGETYEEALSYGLIPKNGEIKRSEFSRYHSQFLRSTPLEIRSDLILKQEPVSKEGQRLFRLFLKVLNVLTYYDSPELIDDLAILLDNQEQVEPLATTTSSAEEVAAALGLVANVDIPHQSINAYRSLFYAVHEISPQDRLGYFKKLPSLEQEHLMEAVGLKLSEYAARQGITELCEHKKVLEVLRKESQKEFLENARVPTNSGVQAARSNIDTYLKVSDRLDKLGEGRVDLAKLFDQFLIVGAGEENGPIESVAGLLEQKKPEVK